MTYAIIVRFDIEGFHCWPGAPDMYARLRERHSHIFHFECHVPVIDLGREVEFLELRRDLIGAMHDSYGTEPSDFRGNSCEMLAKSLSRTIKNLYSVVPIRVAVYEDAFVGAELLSNEE